MPKVSIITVNYKGKRFLEDFFASLEKLNYQNWEVVFFDNASEDGSVEYVQRNHSEVKVMASERNLGFAAANNRAAEQATGEYLFFLNNDTKIDPDAISELVGEMEKNPKIGIGGCRMMSYDGERPFHTGIGIDVFGYPIVWRKVFYVEGAALMIKKRLFKKLGGFDSKYFMFHEDIDLAWRSRLLGYQVRAFPKAVVHHFGGGTAGGSEMHKGKYQSSFLRRYYAERNNIRTLLKNYQIQTLIFIFPCYFLMNLLEVLFFLATFKFKVVYLYLKAYAWNLVNLRDTLRERGKIQSNRLLSDRELMREMYFGSGKLFAFKKTGVPELK